MEFKFNEVKLIPHEMSVEFIAESKNKEIRVIMSILQLAKIWDTDKTLRKGMDFGTSELEEGCKETLELLKNFPNISIKNNSLLFDKFSVKKWQEELLIWVEDLSGWNNEGIRIYIMDDIYNSFLKDKISKVEVNSKSINFLEK